MIYLDYASTTPLHPYSLEKMLPFFSDHFGNPSATGHLFGKQAAAAIEEARNHVAHLIGAHQKEILFTSGATEAINLAIKGVFQSYKKVKGCHFISSQTEHKAVLNSLKAIQKEGAEVTLLEVQPDGTLDPEDFLNALRPDTVLAAFMYGNNETGVLHPLESIGQICREKGVILFSDATQAIGKMEVRPRDSGIHLLAISGHKCYGPKGVGALFISSSSPNIRLKPLLHGGGQERSLRSGTHNVPGIIGLGAIAEWLRPRIPHNHQHLLSLRDTLEKSLLTALDGIHINGRKAPRLPHISNVTFEGTDAKDLLNILEDKLAISTGSACNTSNLTPSHVLSAMGIQGKDAHRSLRLSVGINTTLEDIHRASQHLHQAVIASRKHHLERGPSPKLSGDTVRWD